MPETHGNAAYQFVDRHLTGPASDKAAYIEAGPGGRSLTYHYLALQSDRMAGLYERHGLQPEDRAAMLVLDQIEFPIIFWGSLKAGVVPVPLKTQLSAEDYQAILMDSGARALFVSSELLPAVKPVLAKCQNLKAVFVIEERNAKNATPLLARLLAAKRSGKNKFSLPFSVELTTSAQRPMRAASPGACAFWLYSSEPAGTPQGERHMHSSLQDTANNYANKVLGIRPDDIVFSTAKMSFSYGLGNAMTCPMSVGATTILLSARPTAERVLAVIREKRPTIFCCAPTLYAAIAASLQGKRPEGADRIRCCISAGEALPAEVGQRWSQIFGVDILDGEDYEFGEREERLGHSGRLHS